MTPPRSFRPFLVALGLLVALDVLLRTPLYPSGFPEDFRIPKDTLMEYDGFAGWVGGRPGVRIAVLGDSVIEGHTAGAGETLPARLDALYERQGRDVGAYNFGLRAAQAVDLLGVGAKLAGEDGADLLLVQFDYIYYGNDREPRSYYPELFAKAGELRPIDETALPADVRRELDQARRPPGLVQRADEAASRVWRLYREREHIDAVAFGGRPSVAAEAAVRDAVRAAMNEPGARQLRPEELDPENLRAFFGGGEFAEDNPHVRYLGMLVEKAAAEGVPVVVFNNPLYFEGFEYHDALDMDVYRANVARVRETVESRGGTFVDLAEDFPQEMMLDTAHLLPAGHEEAARRLAREIEPIVTELERGRGAAR